MKSITIGKKYRAGRLLINEFSLNDNIVKIVSISGNSVVFESNQKQMQCNLGIFINNIDDIILLNNDRSTQEPEPVVIPDPVQPEPIVVPEPVKPEPIQPIDSEPIKPIEPIKPVQPTEPEPDFDNPFGPYAGGY